MVAYEGAATDPKAQFFCLYEVSIVKVEVV